jgi:hypothetical protein
MKEALPVLSAGAMVWAAILLARAGVHLRLLLKSGATDAGTSGVDVTVSVAGANAVSIGLSAAAALSLAAAGALCKRAHPLGLQAARGAACVAVAAAAAQWFELIPAMFISLAGLAAAASVLPSAAAAITPPTLAFVLTRTDSVRDAYARVAGEEAGRPAGWEQA